MTIIDNDSTISENEAVSKYMDPRVVLRGSKLHRGFLGIDSLYLVVEYPHVDFYELWAQRAQYGYHPGLEKGIFYYGEVIKKGFHGYKLTIWDGETRILLTDQVDDALKKTPRAGQGMGIMLQLDPKWLSNKIDLLSPQKLRSNVYGLLAYLGLANAEEYPVRINRMDLTLDVIGLAVSSFSVDEWRRSWVGYASKKSFHDDENGKLQGLSIGSYSGSVRFKVYDKRAESIKKGTTGFWSSIWDVDAFDNEEIARFEWSVKCYDAKFDGLRYLSDLSFDTFCTLLNYVSHKWGRLRIPSADTNKTRWPDAPLWKDVRALIEDWTINHDGVAKRDHDKRPDLTMGYLQSSAGWFAGLMAKGAIERGLVGPLSVAETLELLREHGIYVERKAAEKWERLYRESGGKRP